MSTGYGQTDDVVNSNDIAPDETRINDGIGFSRPTPIRANVKYCKTAVYEYTLCILFSYTAQFAEPIESSKTARNGICLKTPVFDSSTLPPPPPFKYRAVFVKYVIQFRYSVPVYNRHQSTAHYHTTVRLQRPSEITCHSVRPSPPHFLFSTRCFREFRAINACTINIDGSRRSKRVIILPDECGTRSDFAAGGRQWARRNINNTTGFVRRRSY